MYSSGLKKCVEGAIGEDVIAIAHDDDLHFIKNTVGSSQIVEFYTQIQPVMPLA